MCLRVGEKEWLWLRFETKCCGGRQADVYRQTTMSAFTEIPIIDLARFDESLEARKSIAKELRHACTEVGFF